MKMSFSAKLLTVVLVIMLVFVVIVTASIPWSLNRYSHWMYDPSFWQQYNVLFYLFFGGMGLLGIWTLLELLFMMCSITSNPYVKRNVSALRRTGIAAILASVLLFAKCGLYYSFSSFLSGVALVIASLFCFTLSSLFYRAVEYKEENDFTI